jgi:ankyrin repeat protein
VILFLQRSLFRKKASPKKRLVFTPKEATLGAAALFLFPLPHNRRMQEKPKTETKTKNQPSISKSLSRYRLKTESPGLSEEKQAKLNRRLRDAAVAGNNAEILRLINDGVNIAAKDDFDKTALHFAAMNGQARACGLIIQEYAKSGGDVKGLIAATDLENKTALHWAAYYMHIQACATLIEKYAEAGDAKELIVQKDKKGETALHLAATGGYTRVCALILQEYAKSGGDIRELLATENQTGVTARYGAQMSAHLAQFTPSKYDEAERFLMSMEWITGATEGNLMKPFYDCVAA